MESLAAGALCTDDLEPTSSPVNLQNYLHLLPKYVGDPLLAGVGFLLSEEPKSYLFPSSHCLFQPADSLLDVLDGGG